MKNWSYSLLSHTAKKYGGPEKYVSLVRLAERKRTTKAVNKKWMRKVVPSAAILVPLAAKGLYDLIYALWSEVSINQSETKTEEVETIDCHDEANCSEADPNQSVDVQV